MTTRLKQLMRQSTYEKRSLYSVLSSPQAHDKSSVVFLHGLGGNRYRTWTHKTKLKECFWPRDLLSKEQDMKNVRVITYGYDADIASWNRLVSQGDILQLGDRLLQDLLGIRAKKEEVRPIIG